jgi:hypothetical protein
MVLIDARFMVIARRSVRGASLKAATFGLWSVDDFHRIAQGHHRDCSCRHSRSLHDHIAVALAPAAWFRDGLLAQMLTAAPGRIAISKTTPC